MTVIDKKSNDLDLLRSDPIIIEHDVLGENILCHLIIKYIGKCTCASNENDYVLKDVQFIRNYGKIKKADTLPEKKRCC